MSGTAEPSIFSRIIAREIPAQVVFEDELVIAIRDIAPKAPVHLLVIPKDPQYRTVADVAAGDPGLLARIVAVSQQLADEHCGGEYRLVFNTGESAGQTVFHVHAHVLGDDAGGSLSEGSLGN
jgi:histidine triad (HIT) family protein